jgi:hypothetical protein
MAMTNFRAQDMPGNDKSAPKKKAAPAHVEKTVEEPKKAPTTRKAAAVHKTTKAETKSDD